MNINQVLTCDVCDADVDVRIGLSNRKVQPLGYACPSCHALIAVTFDSRDGLVLSGASKRPERQPLGTFAGANPFIDLHLDFPVWSNGVYEMGHTPFIVAVQKVMEARGGDREPALRLMGLHSERLEQLNHYAELATEIRTVVNLYFGKNRQLFKDRVSKIIGLPPVESVLQQDLNATLYTFVSHIFAPLVDVDVVIKNVEDFGKRIADLGDQKRSALDAFMDEILSAAFLKNLQRDCLLLYHRMYEAELALRPALFLDLLPGADNNKIAARVSNGDFLRFKDLYKDIAEILGRQLVLVAGLNNVVHRNDHNSFAPLTGGAAPLSSLANYAGRVLSDKTKYLDNCWYEFGADAIDPAIRNAVAHHTAIYDEVNQRIEYGVGKGLGAAATETFTLLGFMRLLLKAFREMHHLHHLIKALFYYDILIRGRSV